MRTLIYVVIALLSIFCFLGLSDLKAAAFEYFGELCWRTPADSNYPYLRLGISHTGGNYFLVQSFYKGDTHYEVASGTAYLDGNQLIISLNYTHSDKGATPSSDADQYGCQYFLDLTTLNMTAWCLTTFYNPDTKTSGVDYRQFGTFTFTSCP